MIANEAEDMNLEIQTFLRFLRGFDLKGSWLRHAVDPGNDSVVLAGGVKGQVTNATASLLDLYPTLLDLADLPANTVNEGRSLKAIVEGSGKASGRVAITSYGHGNHAIRDDRYRYIRFTDGTEEFYDHESDPDEWENLAGDSEYDAVKQGLAQHLPKSEAPFSTVHNGKATNAYFEELYKESGAPVRK